MTRLPCKPRESISGLLWLADVELERLDTYRLALLPAMTHDVLSHSVTLGNH